MHSIRFRYVRLWLARRIGWLGSSWRPLLFLSAAMLFLLVATVAVTALGVRLAGQAQSEWWGTYWWNVLSVYALLVLLLWACRAAWRAQERVVVEEFMDHTHEQPKSATKGSDKQPESAARGLGTLLVVELARLRDLYRVVNDKRANPWAIGNTRSIPATFTVEDDSEALKSAVSTESKFSIGPLTIPVGTFLNLAGRLAQGPRVVGSLHKDGDRLILTAQMIGKGRSYGWRVDRSVPVSQSADHGHHNLDEMVTELACRMFTDLQSESERWRAVWAFNEGLRAYRDCLYTSKDRKPNLKGAEKQFIEALAEDDHFDLVHYNLGLVYVELGQYEAAKAAFSKAIDRNPERREAFYALARVYHYEDQEYESAAQLCERIISLKPGSEETAKAYNLKGLAELNQYWECRAEPDRCSSKRAVESLEPATKKRVVENLERATKSCSRAVALSWRALCVAELRGRAGDGSEQSTVSQPETLASSCLRNLARAYVEQAEISTSIKQRRSLYRRAEALLRQALRLTRSEAWLHLDLGRTYREQGKYNLAVHELDLTVHELRLATDINPAEATFWADLALAYAARNDKESREESAIRACEKALEVVDYDTKAPEKVRKKSKETLENIARAYKEVGQAAQGEHVTAIKEFLEKVEQDANKGEAEVRELEGKLANHDEETPEWERAQASLALGSLYLAANKPEKAETHLQNALGKLEGEYPREIVRLRLRAMLSGSRRAQKKYAKALQQAESALGLDPFNHRPYEELGNVRSDFEALEDAQAAWEIALLWSRPGDPAACTNVARTHYRLIRDCREVDQRNAASQEAAEYLERALGLYGSSQTDSKGEMHHFLGLLRFDSGEYDKAIPHLKVAHALGFAPWITRLFLGEAYRKKNAPNEYIEQYRQLIKEVEKPSADGTPNHEVVGNESGNPMSRGEILARAYLGLSFGYAERNTKPEYALKLVQRAKTHAHGLEDEAAKARCLADCADCEGWILYKQDEIDEAIERLEDAVALNADPEKHLHLALVYEHKAQKCEDETRARSLSTRARTHHRHVRNMDTKDEYSQEADESLSRLK